MSAPVIEWQILANDPESTATFYERLFGWRTNSDNALGYRRVPAAAPNGIAGGIWPAPPESRNFVQLFIGVDDVAACFERARQLGGTPIVPPQKLPDGDELAIVVDPFGMAFGMIRKAGPAA